MIDVEAPNADGLVGVGVSFNKIRRITGYLVGDVRKRFNNAKQAEVKDRVKHFKMGHIQSDKPTSMEYAKGA